MTTTLTPQDIISSARPGDATIDLKLEVVRIPVTDVERSKRVYESLGWRLDADFRFSENERAVQFTPLGSDASIQFDPGGTGTVTLLLVVSDIETAREDLVARGIAVSEVFHREGADAQVPGVAPGHADYGSFAAFTDPDGNLLLLQEVNNRLPGRVVGKTAYGSVEDLIAALHRAEVAHGEYEKELGHRHDDWAPWYAAHMVAEQAGEERAA